MKLVVKRAELEPLNKNNKLSTKLHLWDVCELLHLSSQSEVKHYIGWQSAFLYIKVEPVSHPLMVYQKQKKDSSETKSDWLSSSYTCFTSINHNDRKNCLCRLMNIMKKSCSITHSQLDLWTEQLTSLHMHNSAVKWSPISTKRMLSGQQAGWIEMLRMPAEPVAC